MAEFCSARRRENPAASVDYFCTAAYKGFKIGAKVVRHGRYVTFQLAEVAAPRDLFRKILRLVDYMRPRPAPA